MGALQEVVATVRAVALALAVLAACIALGWWLQGCSSCRVVYAYDGGASARPYYKVRLCPGAKPVVECDSPTRLPTEGCR